MSTQRRIKICHLTSVHNALDTRILYKECASLVKEYDVTLIAPHRVEEEILEVKILPLKKPGSRLTRILKTDLSILFKALSVKARIYHFHDPELIPIGLALMAMGKKVVYDVHENVRADLKEKEWLKSRNIALAAYERFDALAQKQFFIVLAESSYEPFYTNSMHVVVQNFAPVELLEPFRKTSPSNSNKLLIVGSLAGRRGLETAIKALTILKKQGIEILLDCVGEKSKAVEKLLSGTKEYSAVKEQINFLGFKPVAEAYQNAAQYLGGLALPEDLANHRNSYPTKMFEYMAVGLPVICSDFQLYKEVVEKNNCGLVINPSEAIELSTAIKALYDDQQKAHEMGQNGIRATERMYNWATEEEKLLSFYHKIVK